MVDSRNREYFMLTILEDKIATPLGPLWILCDEQYHLRAVEWEEHSNRMEALLNIHYRPGGYRRVACANPGGLSAKLQDYFDGDLQVIETLPTATAGTPFQREVWKALRAIPCGQILSYGQLAIQLGRAGAARTVAMRGIFYSSLKHFLELFISVLIKGIARKCYFFHVFVIGLLFRSIYLLSKKMLKLTNIN